MKKVLAFIAVMIITVDVYAWSTPSHFRYRNGQYEKAGSILDASKSTLKVGAIVDSLPPRRHLLLIQGTPYYYYDGVYYNACPQGYIVVEDPTVKPGFVVSTSQVPAEQLLFEIPNYDGTYKTVTLTRKDGGYISPNGEYYPGQPTVEQLSEYKAAMAQIKAEQQKKIEQDMLQQKTYAKKSGGDSGMEGLLLLIGLLAAIIWCTVHVCRKAINLELVFFKNWFDAIGTMLMLPVMLIIIIEAVGGRHAFAQSLPVVLGYNLFAAWFYNRKNIAWWKVPLLGISRVVVGVILPVLLIFYIISGHKKVKGDDAGNAIREIAHGASVFAFTSGMWLLIKELVNGKEVIKERLDNGFEPGSVVTNRRQMPKMDVEVSSISNKTKKCPYCAEEIKIDALKCRYCGEALAS